MIGTPFVSKNEIEQRKVNRINKKPWEQEVRDEKGRKRFHGAFTGGFSAGYYNTVGSKEGWQPKNLQRSQNQNIMDYMDEEDITNQTGTHTITNRDSEFDNHNIFLERSSKSSNKLNLGLSILDELNFIPKMNQIQQSLMLSSGYSQESCENSALSNQKRQSFKFKDNYEGIGYIKGNELKYDKNTQKVFNIGNSNIMRMNTFEENKSLGFYNERDISDYNFEEVDINENNRNKYQKNKQQNLIEHMPKYIKSKHNLHLGLDGKEFKMPQVPDGFNYLQFNQIGESNEKHDDKINKNDQTKCFSMERRKDILNIEVEQKHLANKFESQSEIMSKKKKSIIESMNQIEHVFNFKLDIPFKDDINKTSRFARFLGGKEGLKSKDNIVLDKNEQIQFEALYQTNSFIQSQSNQLFHKALLKNNDVSNKQSDEVIITKAQWIPSHTLCKKCKIKDPYEKEIVNNSTNSFNSIQMKCLKETNQSSFNYKLNEDELIQKKNNEINTKLLIEAEPDINLFDSIFNS